MKTLKIVYFLFVCIKFIVSQTIEEKNTLTAQKKTITIPLIFESDDESEYSDNSDAESEYNDESDEEFEDSMILFLFKVKNVVEESIFKVSKIARTLWYSIKKLSKNYENVS